MAIVTENLTINEKEFVKTYSDMGRFVIQDVTGILYTEAIDPATSGRTYTESDEEIEMSAEEVLDIILGGEGE